jgi:choice-of-anchor B domain-containing protein
MLFRLRIRRVFLSLTLPFLFAAGIDPLHGSGILPSGAAPLHEEPLGDPIPDPAAQKALARMTGPVSCESGMALATFACRDIDLQGFVSLDALLSDSVAPGTPPNPSGSALWGFASRNDGREYAVFGASKGTAVVDVTDPARPVVVGSVPGLSSPWRELKVYQFFNPAKNRFDAYAYVVSEAPGSGLQILDLTDLPRSVKLAATSSAIARAHTVYLANVDYSTGVGNVPGVPPVLYVDGSNVAGLLAFDISNPTDPQLLGTLFNSYAHDIWAGVLRGERARACPSGSDPCEIVVNWAGDAIRILDFSNKSNPMLISRLIYLGLGYAHSGWISKDGNYLFSMDELDERNTGQNTSVRVIDVRDWTNPQVVALWVGTNKTIEHNGYAIGDEYFLSNYERGLTILDVANPLQPVERAFFDTYPATDTANFHGAWAVYPFLPSGNILISNIDGAGGLFILKEAPKAVAPSMPPRAPVSRVPPRPRITTRPR